MPTPCIDHTWWHQQDSGTSCICYRFRLALIHHSLLYFYDADEQIEQVSPSDKHISWVGHDVNSWISVHILIQPFFFFPFTCLHTHYITSRSPDSVATIVIYRKGRLCNRLNHLVSHIGSNSLEICPHIFGSSTPTPSTLLPIVTSSLWLSC